MMESRFRRGEKKVRGAASSWDEAKVKVKARRERFPS